MAVRKSQGARVHLCICSTRLLQTVSQNGQLDKCLELTPDVHRVEETQVIQRVYSSLLRGEYRLTRELSQTTTGINVNIGTKIRKRKREGAYTSMYTCQPWCEPNVYRSQTTIATRELNFLKNQPRVPRKILPSLVISLVFFRTFIEFSTPIQFSRFMAKEAQKVLL